MARLPGTWESAPPPVDQSVPDMEAVVDAPVPSLRAQDQQRPKPADLPVDPVVDAAGGFAMPSDDDQTSSVRRPVPSADVGGEPVKREGSILDIIMGSGGSTDSHAFVSRPTGANEPSATRRALQDSFSSG